MTAIRRTAPLAPRNTGPKPETIKGKVTLKLVNKGSKSEHRSLVMTVNGKSIKLQRLGGNPFMIDAKEKALVGKNVELKGFFVSENLFRFTSASGAKQ